ncbi:AAA family ATPase [Shewanella algae]|uniref:AAA family ATPase n=1 Tax=Shewanella algae TaxID=38313 RepID=UPI000BB5A7C5|nr:DUF3696 domain-containing protein [Shewanella algae]PBQ28689.1 hypothetical protein AYI97_06550 [Shewanella algae]TVL15151.1 hypothetical protein AYJ02_11475 [Shewanella algae]HEW9977348.1 DUF3696 domain-containing protein [Shewanella algae]
MEIYAYNFKAITKKTLIYSEGTNLVTGKNSGGKSSIIQAILFLKQNIEDEVEQENLKFNNPYLSLGNFKNITTKNINNGDLEFTIKLNKYDISNSKHVPYFRKYLAIKDIEYNVKIESKRQNYSKTNIYIKEISVKINSGEIKFTRTKSDHYKVIFNDNFLDFLVGERKAKELSLTLPQGSIILNNSHYYSRNEIFSFPVMGYIYILIKEKFQNIYYIGPLRDTPKNYYYFEDRGNSKVGIRGEYTAQYLARYYDTKCDYYKINDDGSLGKEKTESTLLEGVSYWLCEVFGFGENLSLDSDRSGVLYQLNIRNKKNQKLSINNVGFGVSQILPIIVQGLSIKTGTLILEQPEIHLHPTVQAILFDFFNSLRKSGISLIIETHSDHLITRMRRRIAESEEEIDIRLIFAEDSNDNSISYRTLEVDELGNFNSWPQGFFDQYDKDIRAILRAQINKKSK